MAGVRAKYTTGILTMPALTETTILLISAKTNHAVKISNVVYTVNAGAETGFCLAHLKEVVTLSPYAGTGTLSAVKIGDDSETVETTVDYLATAEPGTYDDPLATAYFDLQSLGQQTLAPPTGYYLSTADVLGFTLDLPSTATAANVTVVAEVLIEE